MRRDYTRRIYVYFVAHAECDKNIFVCASSHPFAFQQMRQDLLYFSSLIEDVLYCAAYRKMNEAEMLHARALASHDNATLLFFKRNVHFVFFNIILYFL